MKKIILAIFLATICWAGFAQQEIYIDTDTKATITKVPFPNQPDFFGGGQGSPYTWSDFPLCPVEIDGEYWVMYKSGDGSTVFRWKGTNLEDVKRQANGTAQLPSTSKPYMLGGMWYDKEEKKLYAPMHCEYLETEVSSMVQRQIHLASSTDKGLTWKYEGPIVTRDDPNSSPWHNPNEFSGVYYDGGAGDFFIYVDQKEGYVYLFAGSYVWSKAESWRKGFMRHIVARCAMKDKMQPGKWQKFYNGKWEEPGLGGKASYVDAYYVMYNTYLKKYISLNYGNGITVCSDLTKQDWSPLVKVPGDYWGGSGTKAWHVTDANKTDIFTGGQTLYLYSYWDAQQQPVAKKYKIELSNGGISNENGYAPANMFSNEIVTMDPTTFYPVEPLYESSDPIESRRTRRVYSNNPEMSYSGQWGDEDYDAPSTDRAVKAGKIAGNSVQFTFRGADVYWRAVKGPDCGKADVYIDGKFQKTVDCFANKNTAYQIAFMKTGLDARSDHTIKVVVKNEKDNLSTGTTIRHLLFEYSADSYRASDGYSSIKGKNGWYYQQKSGQVYHSDMVFKLSKWVGNMCNGICTNEIGLNHMLAAASDVVRKWIAPHEGTVRIEGKITREGFDVSTPDVAILLNDKEVWPLEKGTEKQTHDFMLKISQGDAVSFVLKGGCDRNPVMVYWDPLITYVEK